MVSCCIGAEGAAATFSTPATLPYATAVHDVEVLPDGHTAVASLRDSNYLRLISLPQLIETDKVSRAGMSRQGSLFPIKDCGHEHCIYWKHQTQLWYMLFPAGWSPGFLVHQ